MVDFDQLLNWTTHKSGYEIGRAFIVRPRSRFIFDETEQIDWIEVCGEIIWKTDPAGHSFVGLEMYYDGSKSLAGFSDVAEILPLPKSMKGCEIDRGIGQIMYNRSDDFKRFGFPDLVKESEDVYLDISWKRHFLRAGYHIVQSIRPQ